MQTAISVEHLAKVYRLGTIGGAMLSEDLSRWWARIRHQPDPFLRVKEERHKRQVGQEFWALEDVSFTVKEGETIGLIGRNGAGKSTLLKILSQVTAPTSGQIRVRGRIASLLEVGTGFHPELTGRENVFLNGAILGMTKAEIRRKFDEIVAFSECAEFIDTPVKRYSSGMHVRLAFAVAAHLEPEILIVDEVLAVGDAQFQKKCLAKMEEVGRHGRTVLFVSHTMSAITRLCARAVLLHDGRVLKDGAVQEVVSAYLNSGLGTTASREWSDMAEAPGDDVVKLVGARVRGAHGGISDAIDIRKPVRIEVEYQVLKDGIVLVPTIHVHNGEGVCAFIACDCDPYWHRSSRKAGRYLSSALIPGNFLAEGTFVVGVALSTAIPETVHVFEPHVMAFEVIDSMDGDSARGDFGGANRGVLRPMLKWITEFEPTAHSIPALAGATP